MVQPLSPAGSLNRTDWWNTGKHVLIVAGASVLAAMGEQVPGILEQLGMPILVPLVTGFLTLAMRWLQNNQK